jgi:hypothetical protein
VRHRTEPYEQFLSLFNSRLAAITRTKTSFFLSMLIALFAILSIRSMMSPGDPPPVPDLVQVAAFTRSFEPLILYSEHSIDQADSLQETGSAVEDLSESVKSTNMTSAAILSQQLDELGTTLKQLSMELRTFFANVDGDVDSIILTMDWAARELSYLPSSPPGPVTSLLTNTHTLLSRAGVLENTRGEPTPLGSVVSTLLGRTPAQRQAASLKRTFHHFLSVLERAIEEELVHSGKLFSAFLAVELQFTNIARTTATESDTQRGLEEEVLGRLWTRLLGGNTAVRRKFQANQDLLYKIQENTRRDKDSIRKYRFRLQDLKGQLDGLRKRLISPLVTAENATVMGVESQIEGLKVHLDGLREARMGQRRRLERKLFGGTVRVPVIAAGDEYGRREIGGGL